MTWWKDPMKNKIQTKKKDVIFIIANLILSVFAFTAMVSFNTEIVSATTQSECLTQFPGGGAGEDATAYFGCMRSVEFTSTPPATNVPATSSQIFLDGVEISPDIYRACNGNAACIHRSLGTSPATTAAGTGGEVATYTPFYGIKDEFLGNIAEGLFWSIAVVAGIQLAGNLFGVEKESLNAASKAAVTGIIAGKALYGAAQKWGESSWKIFGTEGPLGLNYAAWAGIGIGVLIFLSQYKKEDLKTVQFTCLPWQAPTGGTNCEQCNNKDLPCSEYQCKALGQACDLVNKGTSEEKCVWVNRQDVNPPTIEPLDEALQLNYKYNPDGTISPPDRGVKVQYSISQDNCIPAFTPLTFGVKMNEPAACKVDVLRKNNYTEMSNFMSSGLLRYNHTFALSLPGPQALAAENITIQNDGNYNLFVRCQDANGNSNIATFVFKYCVDKGPDTTAPLIVTTNLLNNMPISYNQTSVNIDVYTNEPSSCKWSHNDRDYDSMEQTMSCSTSIFEYNAKLLYKCATNLTGLKSQTANDFYFRCKDKPNSPENERNVNTQSYKFTLIGTQPLVIASVKPNNTILKDSTGNVKATLQVNTTSGYDKGKAICYYSNTGSESSYIKFFKTDSFQHSQDLFLTAGAYNYFVKCTDLGGNTDYETINFTIETDLTVPTVVRAFKEENNLKFITNENATCVYSTFGCNYEFNQGTNITTIDKTSHFTAWNLQTNFYVKCRDIYGNQPNPDRCSITIRPSKLL